MRIRPKKTALEQNRIKISFLPSRCGFQKGSTKVTYMQKIAPCLLSLEDITGNVKNLTKKSQVQSDIIRS